MGIEDLSAGKGESSRASRTQSKNSERCIYKNDPVSSVRECEPSQVTGQQDDINAENWIEANQLARDLAVLLCIGCFLYSQIYDVTQEYVHPNGRSGRQTLFFYSLIAHFSSAIHVAAPFRRLIYRLLGSATVPILFITIVVFSAAISTISIVSFRYFYTHICDVYGPESLIWYYFINVNFLLFTYLLSRLTPSVILVAWIVLSELASRMWGFFGNVTAILADLPRFVQDIQGHLLPVSKFVAHHQSWFLFVWILVLTIYLTRDTPWMKSFIKIVTWGFKIVWSNMLAIVTALGIVARKVICRLLDKMLERVASTVRNKYLQKYEKKIQRLEERMMQLCRISPPRVTLRNKAKRNRAVSSARPTFRIKNSMRYCKKSNTHLKTHRRRIHSASGNGKSVRTQLGATRPTPRSAALSPKSRQSRRVCLISATA